MRKTKVKQARRLVEGGGAEDTVEVLFHPKLFRGHGGHLFLSFRTQYINTGTKGAMKLAKRALRDGL